MCAFINVKDLTIVILCTNMLYMKEKQMKKIIIAFVTISIVLSILVIIKCNSNELKSNELWVLERSYNKKFSLFDETSTEYLNTLIIRLNYCQEIKEAIINNSNGLILIDDTDLKNKISGFLQQNPFFTDHQDIIIINNYLDEGINKMNIFLNNYEKINYDDWVYSLNDTIQVKLEKETEQNERIERARAESEEARRTGARIPSNQSQRQVTELNTEVHGRIRRNIDQTKEELSHEELIIIQENWEKDGNGQIEKQLVNWPIKQDLYIRQIDELIDELETLISLINEYIDKHKVYLYDQYLNDVYIINKKYL